MPVTDDLPQPPRHLLAPRGARYAVGGLLLLVGAYFLQLHLVDYHRLAPKPDGMVLRIEAPAVGPLFRSIWVHAAPEGGAFLVDLRSVQGRDEDSPPILVVDYPAATVRAGDERALAEAAAHPSSLAGEEQAASETNTGSGPSLTAPPAPRAFDFDGDGVDDRIEWGAGRFGSEIERGAKHEFEHGLVRVFSGADGRVLFEDRDPIEYESGDRAAPLGDLDGDGYGELALLHPRCRRSYDEEHVLDRFFDAHSWITVVSGSRLFGDGRR